MGGLGLRSVVRGDWVGTLSFLTKMSHAKTGCYPPAADPACNSAC